MVAEQVGRRITADAHRHPLTAGVVVPRHRAGAAAPLEVVADVIGGHAAQRGFDVVAVPVVGEAGADCAAHDRQAVFGDATALLYLYFCIRFYGQASF